MYNHAFFTRRVVEYFSCSHQIRMIETFLAILGYKFCPRSHSALDGRQLPHHPSPFPGRMNKEQRLSGL